MIICGRLIIPEAHTSDSDVWNQFKFTFKFMLTKKILRVHSWDLWFNKIILVFRVLVIRLWALSLPSGWQLISHISLLFSDAKLLHFNLALRLNAKFCKILQSSFCKSLIDSEINIFHTFGNERFSRAKITVTPATMLTHCRRGVKASVATKGWLSPPKECVT